MNSSRPFIWLHGRRLWHSVVYWLRSLAIIDDTRTGALGFAYTVYSAVIFGAAVFLAWGAMLSVALHLGAALPESFRAPLLSGVVPTGIGLVIAVMLGVRLLTPAWQVSAPDLAYATISPQRTAPLFLSFAPRLVAAVTLTLPVGVFIVVILGDSLHHYGAVMVVSALVMALSLTASWALSLVRLMTTRRSLRAALWVIPVGALIVSVWASGSSLNPASMIVDAEHGRLTQVSLPALAVGFVAMLCALWAAGEHVNMTLLADASTRRAERNALASLSRYDPSLAAQLRRQAAFKTRRRRGRLPEVAGDQTLVARVALGRLRYPGSLWGILRALGVLVTGCTVVLNPQGLTWLTWFFLLVMFPPTTLVEEYEQDMHPFMRQFLPQRRMRILVLDALLPFTVVLLLGVAIIFLLHIGTDPALSSLLLAALLVVSVLTQSLRTALGAMTILPIADILATLISFGLILLFARSGPIASIMVAAFVSLVLSSLVGQSDGPSRAYHPPAPPPAEDDEVA